MAKPSNRKQLTAPGTLWHANALGKGPPRVRRRPEFVHPRYTNIELPLWFERGLSGNEDRQHFDCATWLHKTPRDAEGSSLSGKPKRN
jgi:hypothetical protein